jgi:hypothetical protein
MDGIFRKFEFLSYRLCDIVTNFTRTCARFNSDILPSSGYGQNCVSKTVV